MNQKIIFTFFAALILLSSCGGTNKALESGNYDKAITDLSLDLKKNKNNEKKALQLLDAYTNATNQDLALAERLKQDAKSDPSKWTQLYDVYDRMQIRELQIIPLGQLSANGRPLNFNIPNIDAATEEAKVEASSSLYKEATSLMNTGNKLDARKAYELYDEVVEFNFDYLDAREQRAIAKTTGSTNVYVKMSNQTGRQLPETFEGDLLTFREGSFSDPWILYHIRQQNGVNYEYEVDLDISELVVGRYQEQQNQYRDQQRVVVGYREGTDSEGRAVRIPQYAEVTADVLETAQYKPIRVAGTTIYKEFSSGKVLATIPVEREEAWQNNYAQFRGDERALSQETIAKIRAGQQQPPTDEQMYNLSGRLLNQVVVQLFEQNSQNLN